METARTHTHIYMNEYSVGIRAKEKAIEAWIAIYKVKRKDK